jgi:hypothetical protein
VAEVLEQIAAAGSDVFDVPDEHRAAVLEVSDRPSAANLPATRRWRHFGRSAVYERLREGLL